MALQCGIVGLPNVGKSTLFNCLSNARAQAANFPFCTIEPNVGTITVPDQRLNRLAELVKPQNLVPNTIEMVDIAGLVQGASKGEGLGNQFLANIRETDAILHVLRCFDDPNIVHVHGRVNPLSDKEIIDTELQLKDLDSVDKRLARTERAAKAGDKEAKQLLDTLLKVKAGLERGESVRAQGLSEEEKAGIHDLFLLTSKPVLYVCNVAADNLTQGNPMVEEVRAMALAEGAEVMIICAALESEIAELESFEDRQEFLRDAGIETSGVERLLRAAYQLLQLQTYFTAGEKEVRAWTIPQGTLAPQAAGAIHSDFEKGFIKAEVIQYEDFVKYESWAACREAGKVGLEGKSYLVQDGDIMLFRFNV
ncbi:MAG: redox-regulated ATPase YchF [Sphingomonadales bacterium]|nr:redox-regulated ATPase YchF [Sphingomonadales bacterium]